jgi:molybdopterin-guanine dinucleotide biosynthesis protein MobB
MTVPVVAIVGASDSGRTTLMEAVIGELTGRGFRVATVKHHAHDSPIEPAGKDSGRHARAGAVVSMVSSPAELGIVRRVSSERTLDELAHEVEGEADILLAEGYSRTAPVRVEVSRAEHPGARLCRPEELFALVTDAEDVPASVPVFGLDDARGLAGLVVRTFLEGGSPHGD